MGEIICWLIIHSSGDPATDFRREIRVRGQIIKAGTDRNRVSFAESFAKLGINIAFNPPIRTLSDNECEYVR